MPESVAVALLLILALCLAMLVAILAAARACVSYLKETAVSQRQIALVAAQLQQSSDRSSEELKVALARVMELQEGAVGQIHKIAIHYAPYLRTRADVMHEKDHRDDVHHDLDIDSVVEQEEERHQAHIIANPPDWAEDLTPKYARRK